MPVRKNMKSAAACAIVAMSCLPGSAWAQNIDFQVNNITLEQVVSMPVGDATSLSDAPLDFDQTAIILQSGADNNAVTSATSSPGAAIAVLQGGTGNGATALIENSPGSSIASVQLGQDNAVLAAIRGGANNTIATAQVGNGLGLAAGLDNSTDATLIYGQGGENYNGAVVFRNVPPGTVIRVGD